MKFLKLFSCLSLLAPSVFAAGETLGEYMINHIADSRGEWHPFPYVHVPIDWTFELFGINFAPSLHVMMMILAILVLVPLMVKAAKRKNNAPVSRWGHAIESVVKFLHDDLVVPNVGKKYAKTWMPFVCTLFFFILSLNIFGLVPGLSTATANFSFTAAMAIMVFITFNLAGMKQNGPINYILNLWPHGIPLPVLLVLAPIEVVGLLTKSAALAIRLAANLCAGHFVILSLLGLGSMMQSVWITVGMGIPFAIFIFCLEVLVSFLQAYVFTLLATLFIGSAIHQEH